VLLFVVYDGIKSGCLGADFYLHVVLRVQSISGLGSDVKQAEENSFRYVVVKGTSTATTFFASRGYIFS